MELSIAKQKAINLMSKHGLLDKGWKFEFDNAKRRFGVCKYRTKLIGLSAQLTLLNNDTQVIDTILHEIAHALTPGQHHNYIWKAKAIEIGCNGERCYDSKEVNMPKGNYKAVCPCCKHEFVKFKAPIKTRRTSCGHCGNGRFDTAKLLVWGKT